MNYGSITVLNRATSDYNPIYVLQVTSYIDFRMWLNLSRSVIVRVLNQICQIHRSGSLTLMIFSIGESTVMKGILEYIVAFVKVLMNLQNALCC